MCSNFEFLGLRLKKKDIEKKIGCKVVKVILKHFGYNLPSLKLETDLEIFLMKKLHKLFD